MYELLKYFLRIWIKRYKPANGLDGFGLKDKKTSVDLFINLIFKTLHSSTIIYINRIKQKQRIRVQSQKEKEKDEQTD